MKTGRRICYPNVEKEMKRRGMTKKWIAEQIYMSRVTLSKKLWGHSELTLAEAKAIKDVLGTRMLLEELFQPEEIKP